MPCHFRWTFDRCHGPSRRSCRSWEAFDSIASGVDVLARDLGGIDADGISSPPAEDAADTPRRPTRTAHSPPSRDRPHIRLGGLHHTRAAAPIRAFMPWMRGPSSRVKYAWTASEIAPDCVATTAPSMAGLNPFNASPRAVAYVLTS